MNKKVEKNNSKPKFQEFTKYASNLFEMFKTILGLALIIFFLYFYFSEPKHNLMDNQIMDNQIDSQCTLNGHGRVECTFINDGAKEGSICKTSRIERINGAKHVNKFDSSSYESTQRLCSGLIKPGDVAERTLTIFFKDKSGNKIDIREFCDIEGFSDAWYDGCDWYLYEQAYSEE